jgi:2-keto-4-pentenoate hydratase
VPDSRYFDFARAGEPQILADNACAHRFVLGADTSADWRAIDLAAHRVSGVVLDARGHTRFTREGSGAAVLGDPRLALTWLVNELSALGIALEAGQWVSTGTCMVPLEVLPGDTVQVDYGVLGRMGVSFVE